MKRLVFLFLIVGCQPTMRQASRPYPAERYLFPVIMNAAPTPRSPALLSKKGIGMPYSICEDAVRLKVSWLYNWGENPPVCGSIVSVPMAYNSVPISVGGNESWIMGFNEPDRSDQANLTPLRAAVLWYQLENKYQNYALVAPVPSQDNKQWLVNFRDSYTGIYGKYPRMDALAMHCYSWEETFCEREAQWYFARMSEWGIKQLWVTEYAFFPCYGFNAVAPLRAFTRWVQKESRITRSAWFASRIYGSEVWSVGVECNPTLIDANGLTALGREYLQK